jgi:hypothetical protein
LAFSLATSYAPQAHHSILAACCALDAADAAAVGGSVSSAATCCAPRVCHSSVTLLSKQHTIGMGPS